MFAILYVMWQLSLIWSWKTVSAPFYFPRQPFPKEARISKKLLSRWPFCFCLFFSFTGKKLLNSKVSAWEESAPIQFQLEGQNNQVQIIGRLRSPKPLAQDGDVGDWGCVIGLESSAKPWAWGGGRERRILRRGVWGFWKIEEVCRGRRRLSLSTRCEWVLHSPMGCSQQLPRYRAVHPWGILNFIVNFCTPVCMYDLKIPGKERLTWICTGMLNSGRFAQI